MVKTAHLKLALNTWCAFLFLTCNLCATNRVSVAVLDFAQMQTGQAEQKSHRWLSKALSDLLIGDLGTHRELRLVTRENMRMLMQEADLRELSGLTEDRIDPDEYRRMQQYLKVDQMVFGKFSVNTNQIHIQAQVIDHDTGAVLAGFSQTGALTNALDLEKALARDMLHYFSKGEIPPEAWVLPKWTDSMEASELLYDGVDAFDAGLYNQAWYCFRRAAEVDLDYADASYWIGRMYYYRQDYTHAHTEYRSFVRRFPDHARVGDAITEYVHSRECGAPSREQILLEVDPEGFLPGKHEPAEPTPTAMLELYRDLRAHDWTNVYVHNKVNYASRSPLDDWLMKREQQALAYMGRFTEAFVLLDEEFKRLPEDPADVTAQSWRNESRQLMSMLAMQSEDINGERLVSEFLESKDYQLTLDNLVAEEDLHGTDLNGNRYKWGTNWRILAPPGYAFKTVRTQIFRTNDPKVGSICRLQIRRYRYVDIETCATGGRGPNEGVKYEKTIEMPVGITWFYLRPEYNGRNGASQGSFDGWRLEADLVPIPENAGGIRVEVDNAYEYNIYLNDIYTRCYNGVVRNLAPGTYTLRIGPMWNRIPWAFNQLEREVEVTPGEIQDVKLHLSLTNGVHAAGWKDPVGIALSYPTFKHRPRPDSNWMSGPPATCINPKNGHYLTVWSHLDDLWFSTSEDGTKWSDPDTLPPPVNSADAEINPRIIMDNQGRYCMMFLSNRGMSRNLAVYVSWSRNLRRWSRPVMLNSNHHSDHDFIQDDKGQYLLLLVPERRTPFGDKEQDATITLQTSRDLVEWTTPVAREVWRRIFIPEGESKAETSAKWRAYYERKLKPSRARIVQDPNGLYHIVWAERGNEFSIWRSWSRDLDEWSTSDVVPCTLRLPPHNIAVTATDSNLMVAMIASDGWYSGHEMFDLSSAPLPVDYGKIVWRTMEIPPITISGMPNMIYDARRKSLVLTWQIAEQTLHPTRSSGPVFVMTGSPIAKPLKPRKFAAMDVKLGADLDKLIAKLSIGETLEQTDVDEARKLWHEYYSQRRKKKKKKKYTTKVSADNAQAAFYLNAFRMALIDPEHHGGWPWRYRGVRDVFHVLQQQVEATGGTPVLRAAFICPAIFNDRTNDAIEQFKILADEDQFSADCVIRIVRRLAAVSPKQRQETPRIYQAADSFLEAVQ